MKHALIATLCFDNLFFRGTSIPYEICNNFRQRFQLATLRLADDD
jgi:hypothetical protein